MAILEVLQQPNFFYFGGKVAIFGEKVADFERKILATLNYQRAFARQVARAKGAKGSSYA